MTEPPSAGPIVWLLTDDRPGNRTQVLGAARALGLPSIEKALCFRTPESRWFGRRGASLDTLDDRSREQIAPPFPDLVIAAGRRSVPVVSWIKQASRGRAKAVLLGRKTPDGVADLTVRLSYFRQVPDPKLLEIDLPLTQVDRERLDEIAKNEPDPLAGLQRPRTAFLVGGPTGQHDLTAEFAGRMAQETAAAAAETGGGLAIVTSPRTPTDAVAAIRAAAGEARLFEWSPDRSKNPYLAILANADLLVVTGESESMLAEAIQAQRPLTIYPLHEPPMRPISLARAWIARTAIRGGLFAPLCRKIMSDGLVTPRREFAAFHRMIEERGWGRVFDGRLNRKSPAPHDERERLADRMRSVLGT
ncbi:ELM1/GtrOC1 family putative glycosyltransferase [Hansschlegelia zhihuaiae]|nr:ELM1/GtrOC1 family putative glycosyltransferase [Hansschlegelia zhihuaiae]